MELQHYPSPIQSLPRMSMVTCKPRYHLVYIVSLTLTFRSSKRKLPLTALIAKILTTLGLSTDGPTNLFATRIDKLEAGFDGLRGDVSALKRDVSSLKADIKELGPRLERKYALNQAKQVSDMYFRS